MANDIAADEDDRFAIRSEGRLAVDAAIAGKLSRGPYVHLAIGIGQVGNEQVNGTALRTRARISERDRGGKNEW